MNPPVSWPMWCPKMPRIGQSRHFVFYGIHRNPADESDPFPHIPHAIHGVRLPPAVAYYAKYLELAYAHFIEAGRPAPDTAVGPKGDKIPIHLMAADQHSGHCDMPCTWPRLFEEHRRYAPAIVLPVRCMEPTRYAERQYIASTAVHELSHVFGMRQLPLLRYKAGRPGGERSDLVHTWIWFCEGIAVADEARVLPRQFDWMRYAIRWLDHPEIPLAAWDAQYQSAFFVRYLDEVMKTAGADPFCWRVWDKSATVWTAVDVPGTRALTALMALEETLREHGRVFCSADPSVRDIFASGYCMDSYFLWDPASPAYQKATEKRYPGGRGITRSWTVAAGQLVQEWLDLSPLACRYFRFFPSPASPSRMEIVVEVDDHDPAGPNTKAEVATALVGSKARGGETIIFHREPDGDGYKLVSDRPLELSAATCDHGVLVVTNCSESQPVQIRVVTRCS